MSKSKSTVGKYSTYVLELIRNNGITGEQSEEDESGTPSYNFLLFDYFDILHCKKLVGEDKKYLNYLSIENVFETTMQHNEDYKVSYKTLSLYGKSKHEQSGSASGNADFFSISSEGNTLSESPFLGIIQISLCKDNYIIDCKQNIENIDIDAFLQDREEQILNIVDGCKFVDESIKMQRRLFRSSTTGDFCLVIRTNLIKLIYDIAIALNGTQNHPEEKNKMLTFTNIGIECKYVKGKGYATLDAATVRKNPEKIALRFSADESVREELQEYIKEKGNVAVEGLFGRYEYLLTIGMEEFAGLYPFLCERKLGRKENNRVKTPLETILRNSLARSINERILIELDSPVMVDMGILSNEEQRAAAEKQEREEKEDIFVANKELLEKIGDLKEYKNLFQEEHFAFQDLVRGMTEIYKSFSSAGMDKESYINWRVFHRDMDVLCGCICEMMENYKNWVASGVRDEFGKKRYRRAILSGWRENLNAINRYTTLVQNVNYQTYQSPSYEIQTQIDAEKEMVAYREAMELYITYARQIEEDSKVYPLIYPDLSKEKVAIIAPFRVAKPDAKMTACEIICTVPSFEYFARLYDLLPWIIHETSHHLRVITREKRNRFVTDYILFHVFEAVMYEPLRKLSDCDFYGTSGKAVHYLLICMTVVAAKRVASGNNFKECNFEKLVLEMESWLKNMFPAGEGYYAVTRVEEEENLKDRRFCFWLDAYRKELMLDAENMDLILNVWDHPADLEGKQELAQALLERYYENLEKTLGDRAQNFRICLEDIEDSILMEKKLVKLATVDEDEQTAAREYYEQIIAISRIMKYEPKTSDKNDEIRKYFKDVFKLYKKNYKEEIMAKNTIIDTVSMRVMRNLGLLHENEKSDIFVQEMMKISRKVNYSQIIKYKEMWQRTYLETYADILMATSLQLTGFGYCRLVLQTASDAKLIGKQDEYRDINYSRWRTVAAVLLADPEECKERTSDEEAVEIDAKRLVEEAQDYCEYVINHISKKLSESDKLKSAEQNKVDKNSRQLLRELLWKINEQMRRYLLRGEDDIRKVLLIDILLHGDTENIEDDIKEEWRKYEEAAEYCNDVKYNFWRLACFCKGIVNIVKNGKIVVPENLFRHMMEIREMVNSNGKKGCKWENENKCLIAPKYDVGSFYNQPNQVCEKTPDQKLENTIDFIQNYYYYNRFRVVNNFFSSTGSKKT
ncbi:MAG: hypothetical protein NC430_08050 [bacterium]|nr:hypothetical protein [bacterium]